LILDIVAEHASEASFLAFRRKEAVMSPLFTLADLIELDDRLAAHMAGLFLAEDKAWDICTDELGLDEPGDFFVMMALALQLGSSSYREELVSKAIGSPEFSEGLVDALGWHEWQMAAPVLRQLMESDDADMRRLGIAGAAAHRADIGPLLNRLLQDEAGPVRSRAIQYAGEVGRVDCLADFANLATTDDNHQDFWKAWSAVLLGEKSFSSNLKRVAESEEEYAVVAANLYIRCIPVSDARNWLKTQAESDTKQRLAIRLAGYLGDPQMVGWLIEFIRQKQFPRLALQSIVAITGVDPEIFGLTVDPADEDLAVVPNDDPADENVEPDPDEGLPWPESLKLTEWWMGAQRDYLGEQRLQYGRPITGENLLSVLKSGTQSLRESVAIEAALIRSDRALFNIGAPGRRQAKALGLQQLGG